jgi:Tfp pilus assembly protein PilN
MTALAGSFVTIKMSQRSLDAKEGLVRTKLARAQEAIGQFENLQTRRKAMMKTALTTAELIEPVPRSVLLASLTNSLPAGVSLLRLNVVQKESKLSTAKPATKYQKARTEKAAAGSLEKLLETHIDIEGLAPSDRQVAAYIQSLGVSSLLTDVALVESKEHKAEDTSFRQFKLTAMLEKDIQLTKEDVERIRTTGEKAVWSF